MSSRHRRSSNRAASVRDPGGDAWSATAALALLTLAVFWVVLKYGFVNYDDPVFVVQNPMIQKGLQAETLRWAFSSLYIYWQPLTWISYMLDYSVAGASAPLFHGTNLALHVASTILLFLALREMTGNHWRSVVVAALFAIHPLHVETVAWISERKGVLSGFFWALALLAYARYARRPGLGGLTLVTVFFACGLMSKSIVVTLPCVLLLLDYWPLRRWRGLSPEEPDQPAEFPRRNTSQLLLEKVPLFALAILSSFLTVAAQKRMGAVLSTEMFSIGDRFAIVVTSYLSYLRKLFWPADLAVFYPNPGAWPAWEILTAVLVIGVVTAGSLWQAKRRPYLIVGWLFFLGVLLPVSGVLQTGEQLMADRYTYLPLTGLFVMLVWLGSELLASLPGSSKVLGGGTVVLLILCAAASSAQLTTWGSTRNLFEQANRVTRDNYLAHTVLGTMLSDERKYDEAMAHFEAALKTQPRYAETHYRMALSLAAQRKWVESIQHFEAALKEDPSNADILAGAAAAFAGQGNLEGAVNAYEKLLRLRPRSVSVLHEMAMLLQQHKKYPEAIQRYRECVKLDPSRAEALNNLAWILATHSDPVLRNGAEAVQLAEFACKITSRKVPVLLGTLSAAYAETGRFADAAKVTLEAEKLAKEAGLEAVATRNAELRKTYESGKPWRELNP